MDQLNLTSSNFTNSSTAGPPSSVSGLRTLVPVGLMSLCFLVGIPGNIAVLILRPNWQKLSRLTQCLMMNLALSDLLCLITLPIWIYAVLYNWALGITTCKMLGFVMHCSIFSSVLTITALSVQRYMQVIHPQRCIRFKKRFLILLWLMSMVLSIQALMSRQIIKDQHQMSCFIKYNSTQHVAMLLTECFFGFSSFTITACAYIFLHKKLNQAVFFNNPSTFKLITIIIVTFFVFSMPYLVFNLVMVGAQPAATPKPLKMAVIGQAPSLSGPCGDTVLLSLCFLVGFPGNIAVLILRPNWQQLSRLTQCLMMNLASSDLLCLVTLPN
ncbi:leukotriene B4 receptor 1-like [Periophthalmus magnuspinnatus]|uniref:leukotriene B4 receptor 1-like n=1 Tax=Periophthalmus magnuspinnatus TaxID=409849 RepID=UPI00145BCA60|nr:leukotriene B4 receptor 1-like [Periophthalmus magnuspinnatus]